MGLTLFQASGSPKWPGQVGSSGRWGKNSTWDGTKGDTLALPSAFRFSDNSMSIRSDVKDLAFGPGGDVLHTQMTPRSLVVEGECIDDPGRRPARHRARDQKLRAPPTFEARVSTPGST